MKPIFDALRKFLLVGICMAAGGVAVRAQTGAEPAAPPVAARVRTVSGKLVDPSGVGVAGANVKLSRAGDAAPQETQTSDDGQFTFARVAPGVFKLTISANGFAQKEFSGTLRDNEDFIAPQIALALAEVTTEVKVVPPQVIAEAQIKEEEKQRALGFIPNYYVSYRTDAVALAPKQKFELAWKTLGDPVSFGITGAIAGIEQAQNRFSGYGQGADGYAKRYGAAYADFATSTVIGSAILPSLFHQDPRYFYKGTGSTKSRLAYAIANSVICKGDNGHWQANYSAILGGLAAAGISNAYYPAKDRNGAGLTFENALIGIGATAAANIMQEFVIKKLTPSASKSDPNSGNSVSKPLNSIARVLGKKVREGD